MSVDNIIADLQRDLRKALKTEALRKSFDSIFSQTFALQPPTELLKGLSPIRKLGVLKTALLNFDQANNVLFYTEWVQCMFKMAEKLINMTTKASKECKMIPKPATSTNKPEAVKPQSSPIADQVVKKASAKVPTTKKQEKLYEVLKSRVSQTPRWKADYVDCVNPDCKFCQSLFANLPLSRCTHQACVSGAWYPHIGYGLWKSLQKYHAADKAFVPKEGRTLPEGKLLSISDYYVKRRMDENSNTAIGDMDPSDSSLSVDFSPLSDTSTTVGSEVDGMTPPLADSVRYTPYGKHRQRQRSMSPWHGQTTMDC